MTHAQCRNARSELASQQLDAALAHATGALPELAAELGALQQQQANAAEAEQADRLQLLAQARALP